MKWVICKTVILYSLFNLLIGLDGYTIATGILNSNLNGDNIVSIPLDIDDPIELVISSMRKLACLRWVNASSSTYLKKFALISNLNK